jgi:hypothetical protein
MRRRHFLKSLAMDLVKEHRSERAASSHVAKNLATKPQQQVTSPAREPEAKRPKHKGRCAICPRSEDRKTSHMCQKCEKYLCVKHAFSVCEECLSVPEMGLSE